MSGLNSSVLGATPKLFGSTLGGLGGVVRFQSDVDDIKDLAGQAEQRRNKALAPLRSVARFTDGQLSYDPSFPIESSFQFPRTAELKANAIVSLLRKVFLQKVDEVT